MLVMNDSLEKLRPEQIKRSKLGGAASADQQMVVAKLRVRSRLQELRLEFRQQCLVLVVQPGAEKEREIGGETPRTGHGQHCALGDTGRCTTNTLPEAWEEARPKPPAAGAAPEPNAALPPPTSLITSAAADWRDMGGLGQTTPAPTSPPPALSHLLLAVG